ncbi:MAG: LysM peptidoglycan-binding domain-containing protein [Aggregatilineales bacterium]
MTGIRRWPYALLIGLLLAGCRSDIQPPAPTVIPTLTATVASSLTPTPSPSPSGSIEPSATFRPVITSTSGPTTAALVINTPTNTPTLGPICITAKQGDTIGSLLSKGGYGDFSAAAAFRELNHMPPGSNDIVAGQQYCIPRPTPTPTPQHWEQTLAIVASLLPTAGAQTTIPYTVQKNDGVLSIELKFGITLAQLCALNPMPNGLNCGGCNLKAIGQEGCHPIVVVGQILKVPGPTPTPTITPTLTGSETATSTPSYSAPRILYPANGTNVSGAVRLEWLPTRGLLQPDDVYLILLTDTDPNGSPRNIQYTTQATSWLIPGTDIPADNVTHIVYWQVSVAHLAADGSAVLLSDKSAPASFTWTRQ